MITEHGPSHPEQNTTSRTAPTQDLFLNRLLNRGLFCGFTLLVIAEGSDPAIFVFAYHGVGHLLRDRNLHEAWRHGSGAVGLFACPEDSLIAEFLLHRARGGGVQ
jgi:hypothetical protein